MASESIPWNGWMMSGQKSVAWDTIRLFWRFFKLFGNYFLQGQGCFWIDSPLKGKTVLQWGNAIQCKSTWIALASHMRTRLLSHMSITYSSVIIRVIYMPTPELLSFAKHEFVKFHCVMASGFISRILKAFKRCHVFSEKGLKYSDNLIVWRLHPPDPDRWGPSIQHEHNAGWVYNWVDRQASPHFPNDNGLMSFIIPARKLLKFSFFLKTCYLQS